jgi:hypothetical protein
MTPSESRHCSSTIRSLTSTLRVSSGTSLRIPRLRSALHKNSRSFDVSIVCSRHDAAIDAIRLEPCQYGKTRCGREYLFILAGAKGSAQFNIAHKKKVSSACVALVVNGSLPPHEPCALAPHDPGPNWLDFPEIRTRHAQATHNALAGTAPLVGVMPCAQMVRLCQATAVTSSTSLIISRHPKRSNARATLKCKLVLMSCSLAASTPASKSGSLAGLDAANGRAKPRKSHAPLLVVPQTSRLAEPATSSEFLLSG